MQELIWITTFSESEKEELARLYIEDVEKHGVDLKGLYSRIPGGKDNAYKDLEKLIQAIDKMIEEANTIVLPVYTASFAITRISVTRGGGDFAAGFAST